MQGLWAGAWSFWAREPCCDLVHDSMSAQEHGMLLCWGWACCDVACRCSGMARLAEACCSHAHCVVIPEAAADSQDSWQLPACPCHAAAMLMPICSCYQMLTSSCVHPSTTKTSNENPSDVLKAWASWMLRLRSPYGKHELRFGMGYCELLAPVMSSLGPRQASTCTVRRIITIG
jgi:hypothetical protein